MSQADMPFNVAAVYDTAPPNLRTGMLALRNLIFRNAESFPDLGDLTETLRWGQPSYFPTGGGGSTLRIAPHGAGFGLFAHCQTNIISSYASWFGEEDRILGNRGVLFDTLDDVNPDRLALLIGHALTYHKPEMRCTQREIAA